MSRALPVGGEAQKPPLHRVDLREIYRDIVIAAAPACGQMEAAARERLGTTCTAEINYSAELLLLGLAPHIFPAAAARMARHTRSGVAGISTCRTPSSASASTIALITAASAGVVPPSPPERTPSLFVGAGTWLSSVASNGSVSARGIA